MRIAGRRVSGRALLAPMSGVTDAPFRRLVHRLGASMVVSEMVASEELAGRPESVLRTEGSGLPLHVVQLAGREARWMAEAARRVVDAGADIVDINMGCPARKVTRGWSGSALMRDLDHACRLIEATVKAARVPVTLKMRLGWDRKQPERAGACAAGGGTLGVAMITVHGRTRCDFYRGKADWAAVRAVKETRLGSGDRQWRYRRPASPPARRWSMSGADGVMIGRGACGRPWMVGAVAQPSAAAPAGADRRNVSPPGRRALRGDARTLRIASTGVRVARKHLGPPRSSSRPAHRCCSRHGHRRSGSL
jgi:tRNA-dihydrouridine synthase B